MDSKDDSVASQANPLRKHEVFLMQIHFSPFNSLFELEPLTKVCFGFDEKFDARHPDSCSTSDGHARLGHGPLGT
jgi:hypothetical protein